MALNELLDTVREYATPIGYGAAVGTFTYFSLAFAKSLGRGTNFRAQISSPVNLWGGVGMGALIAVLLHDNVNLYSDASLAARYVGAGASGAVFGAALNPVIHAMSSNDSVADNFGNWARRGAWRGALIVPVIYSGIELITKAAQTF